MNDRPKITQLPTPAQRDIERLVAAVEDIRAQLEARGQKPETINQTLGTCYAVYLLQRLE